MKHARIEARTTSISASANPTPTVIAEFESQIASDDIFDAGYFIIQVTDKTNNRYQMSEFIVVDDYVEEQGTGDTYDCLLYTSPSPRDGLLSRMPSSA